MATEPFHARSSIAVQTDLSMSPQYEILHLFSAQHGHLAEVRRLDQPIGAAKA